MARLDRTDRAGRNIIRAWNRPERESTEGKHGTKAESEGQAENIGVRDSETVHSMVCNQFWAQVGMAWRAANYGSGAKIPMLKILPSPLADEQQGFLQDAAKALITDRNTGPVFQDYIDKPKLLDRTEVPRVSEEEAQKAKTQREEDAKAMLQMQSEFTKSAQEGIVPEGKGPPPDRAKQMGLPTKSALELVALAKARTRRYAGNGRH